MFSINIFILKLPFFLLIPYLIPLAFLLWFIVNFGVNVPFGDQWELVTLFQAIISGKATFQIFFAQHNEHRILFPKLIMSALALSSDWNIQWEFFLSVALAAIVFLSLFKVSFDQAEKHNKLFHFTNISICLIIFSFVQWENWLWGFQLSWFLIDACLAVAILSFSSSLCKTLRVKLLIGALACFIASFSAAHGLLTWIALVPSLLVICRGDARLFRKVGLLWLILFLATCCLYFFDYHQSSNHPDLWLFLKKPKLASTYFLMLLGSPLLHSARFSISLGLAVLINFGFFFLIYVSQIGSKISNDAAPWISMGCFAILFDLVTTVGRAGFGVNQATSSRYTTVAILLVIALIQLWRLAWQRSASKILDPSVGASVNVHRKRTSINTLVISVLTLLVLVASINSLAAAEGWRSRLQYGQACLEIAAYVPRSPDNCLQLLYPDANAVIGKANVLNQIGLRHFPEKAIRFMTEPTEVYGYLDIPAASEKSTVVRKHCFSCAMLNASGWAILPKQSKSARLVLLGLGNRPETFLATAYVNLNSPDVVKAMGSERYQRSRWQAIVSPKLLPLGETRLTAWVYNPDSRAFIKLRGELKLSVEE